MKVLRPYQVECFHYTKRTDTPALFMEMRLGKTLITVYRINSYSKDTDKILVVGPYSVLYGWLETVGKNCYMFSGTGQERVIGLASAWYKYKYFLINKEGFLNCPTLHTYPWDCVVLDESTFIRRPWKKNKKTKKYSPQITHYFCTKFKDVKYKWILTGTPKIKSELDYFCQLYFLNPEILGFNSYWQFRNKCFVEAANNEWYIKRKFKDWLNERLAENCFFLKRKDVGLGGEKFYKKRMVKGTPEFYKVYNKVEKEFLLSCGVVNKATIWSMEKFIWSRRLCGGFVDKEFYFDHKEKELLYLLENELANEPVIIWCFFVEEIKRLHSLIPNSLPVYGKISPNEREKVRLAFSRGEVTRFIGQPGCFKYGTDLSIADVMVYYSTPYSETRSQSEDRFVRIGKEGSLLVIDLITEGTVEDSILKGIRKLESDNDLSHRIIKDIQERVFNDK